MNGSNKSLLEDNDEREEEDEESYERTDYNAEEGREEETEFIICEDGDDSLYGNEEEAGEKESVSSIDSMKSIYSKLSPFNIVWSFGIKTKVELINLTTDGNFELFYVSSHFGVIYNYRLNKMRFLPGHNFPIVSISADATGRWLVTADCGEDTVIIIWDNKKRVPAWSLYNVFSGGVKCAKISPDARFLAAINCNFNYKLKFWRWTLGLEQSDGEIDIDPSYGPATHVDFNHKKTEQFVLTTKSRVIFMEWILEKKEINSYAPEVDLPKKVGSFGTSLFLDDNHTALTSTNTGYLVVWCDVNYCDPISENTLGSIERKFLKIVKIHKAGITSMQLCDGVLVTSSEDGIIFFHDQFLRLVYVLPRLKLDPIVSVSFNKSPSDYDPFLSNCSKKFLFDEEINSADEDEKSVDDDQIESENLEDKDNFPTFPTFESRPKQIPSDCTIEMRPFVIRDFVFLTKTGVTGYLSHQRKKIKYFLKRADSCVTALNCSPNKNHIVISYSTGYLNLYDYISKNLLISVNIPGTKISTLKYLSYGNGLLVGTESGGLIEFDPLLLTAKHYISYGKSPIQKICVATNDEFIAFYDQESVVSVFQKNNIIARKKWTCMGKYISHYKPINDILFQENREASKHPRLFTIGEDRMLVEYDMANLETNKLKLLQLYRIEQTAIPYCFIWHPDFNKTNDFLISNSEYKLKLVDSKTNMCKKTTLGPTADTPIKYMKVLAQDKKESSATRKMIYGTNKHIGIQILPSTGNPFEGLGIIAHPEKLKGQVISYDQKYVFTAGVNDSCILMWEINIDSVDIASQIGGTGLEPFISLIEGGPNSFFFREIEDFFYYAQIIHQGEDPNLDRSVTKSLALCEIPDLFRALGYYPTDYEIDNLMYELKHIKYNETGETVNEVSFEECVKAFLNHKPVHGICLSHINTALTAIADLSDPTDILVERNELYKALEEKAEAMEHKEVLGYLCILLLPKDENNPVPPTLSLQDFASNVLGIDLTISEEHVRQITHAFEQFQNVSE